MDFNFLNIFSKQTVKSFFLLERTRARNTVASSEENELRLQPKMNVSVILFIIFLINQLKCQRIRSPISQSLQCFFKLLILSVQNPQIQRDSVYTDIKQRRAIGCLLKKGPTQWIHFPNSSSKMCICLVCQIISFLFVIIPPHLLKVGLRRNILNS